LMLSGVLPDARRRQIAYAVIASSLLIAVVACFATWPLISRAPSRSGVPLPVLILMGVLLFGLVVSTVQMRQRLITRFNYDGATLYYQTLARPEPQSRATIELQKIDDWRGRGGSFGYILVFRDGQKLNVDRSMSNSGPLIAQLQQDRWPETLSV